MQPRAVVVVLEGSTYFVRYVSRGKFTRHSAAQFYAPDHTLESVKQWVRQRSDLVLSEGAALTTKATKGGKRAGAGRPRLSSDNDKRTRTVFWVTSAEREYLRAALDHFRT